MRPELAIYADVLPRREWLALEAWLSTFYPFQLRWMLERAKRAAVVKARQIGWSHTTAGNGTLWGAFHGELTTIVSKGEQESIEVLEKARRHAQVLESLGSRFARVTKDSASEIHFESGGRVMALPSSGGRGYTGNLILDEFAYHQHAKATWDSAVPAMRLGDFRLRVISTPNGPANEYANLIAGIRSGKIQRYALHEVTIDDALADGFPVNLEECWADAKGDPRLFDQLYRCKFLDGEMQYIPTDLITEASVDDLYTYEGEYFAGLDIGRTVDRTVLVVVRKLPDGQRFLSWIASCKRTDSDALEALVEWAFQVFKLRRLCVDATGMGAFPAERMQKRHGKMRVEPVNFTAQVKEDLATGMYSGFSERTVKIARTTSAIRLPHGLTGPLTQEPAAQIDPRAAEQLREDLCAIRREITSAGNVRYDAPRTDEGHADSAWAFALALHASGNAPGKKHEIAPQSLQERQGATIIA